MNTPSFFILDDKFNRSRPNGNFNLPSLSDQILDSAGMKLTGDSFLDEALADLKSKRRQTGSDPEELSKVKYLKVEIPTYILYLVD